jgi:hypothetical protein
MTILLTKINFVEETKQEEEADPKKRKERVF